MSASGTLREQMKRARERSAKAGQNSGASDTWGAAMVLS